MDADVKHLLEMEYCLVAARMLTAMPPKRLQKAVVGSVGWAQLRSVRTQLLYFHSKTIREE